MTIWLIMAVIASTQPVERGGWTWSLYGVGEGGTVVLANEIPDTPDLRATLECEPGSGAARVSVFGAEGAASGYVSIRSGAATATSQGEVDREDGATRLTASLRLEHPVFTAFLTNGELTLNQNGQDWMVRLGRRHRGLLTDFAVACDG